MLSQALNGFKQTMSANGICMLLIGIADTADNTQKIQANHCLLVVKFLDDTSKKFPSSKRSSDRGTQPEQFLERFQKIMVERVGVRGIEAVDDCLREVAFQQASLHLRGLFLEPIRSVRKVLHLFR